MRGHKHRRSACRGHTAAGISLQRPTHFSPKCYPRVQHPRTCRLIPHTHASTHHITPHLPARVVMCTCLYYMCSYVFTHVASPSLFPITWSPSYICHTYIHMHILAANTHSQDPCMRSIHKPSTLFIVTCTCSECGQIMPEFFPKGLSQYSIISQVLLSSRST